MNKKQLIVAWIISVILLLAANAYAGKVTKPLGEKEVKRFLGQLNSQGIIASWDENVKENKMEWWDEKNLSFSLESVGVAYFLYRADINNDSKDEYVLCTRQGSGSYFDIEAIYWESGSKLTDISDQIKLPLRKLIRDAEKEDYDLEDSRGGFMNGSIRIEKDNGKVYFTLEQITRDYPPAKDHFYHPPQGYKFLWDKNGIKLVQYYVGNKVYKP